jgi:hypothetical protein
MLRETDQRLGYTSGSSRALRRAIDVAEAREGKRILAARVIWAVALLVAAGGAIGFGWVALFQ